MTGKKYQLATNAILNCLRACSNIFLPLISFPYLTRVLQVNNFGKVAFCSSIVSYFTLVANLGISNYSIREGASVREDKVRLSRFADEIFTIHITAAFIAYVLLAVFLLIWYSDESNKVIVAILSVNIICTALSFDWLPNVLEDFWFITIRVIGVQMLSLIAIFVFVKSQQDYIVYACIIGGTSILSAILNYCYAKKYIKISFVRKVNWKKHLKPILLLFANTLMITIYLQSDITMLGIFRGDYEVGLYKISVQIYSAIKTMLNAITVAVIPRMSLYLNDKRKDEYNRLGSSIIWCLAYLCLPAMIGLFFIAKNCIILIGGGEYISSVPALKILCFALAAAVFGNYFINAVLIVNRKEKKAFYATIISAMVNIILNLFFIPQFGFVGAAITTLIAEIVVMGFLIYFSRKLIKITLNHKVLLSMCIGTTSIIIVCQLLNKLGLKIAADTVLKIICSVFVYAIVTVVAKKAFDLSF